MREIKFRVWDKPRKKFAKQITTFKFNRDGNINLVVYLDKANKTQKITEQEKIYTNEFEVVISTGLKDKNGKEIYEGDVIKFHTGDICEVVFIGGSFEMISRVGGNKGEYFVFPRNKDIDELSEVIGNIFENPELLEQEG